jgi:hypothetical protein
MDTPNTSARGRALITAIVAAIATFVPVAAAAAAKTPHRSARSHRSSVLPAPTGGVVQFNREQYHLTGGAQGLAALARSNQVVVLNGMDGNQVRTLHRLNPHLIVLLYQFVGGAKTDDPSGLNYCVTPQQVQRGNWYLRNSRGQAGVLLRNTPGTIGVDPGNVAYQRACASHAASLAHRYGFNGVMFDGFDARLQYEFPGVDVPEYASVSKYLNAMTGLLRVLRNGLHQQHVTLWGNIGGATATPGLWQRWAGIMDGAMEESWTDGSLGLAQQLPDFPAKLADAAWSEAHHKYVLEHTWNTTEAGNTFGLAAALLVAGGYTSYSTNAADYGNGQTLWFPEFDTARRLGLPTGHYRRLRNGVYVRHFQHGMVVVNASTRALGVPFGGMYSGTRVAHATAARLDPTSALVLLAG